MDQIIQNELIESAKVGFFEEGLSRGSYGLQLRLHADSHPGPLTPKIYSAMKTIIEEDLPKASKKARVFIPERFYNKEALHWLLAVLRRYGILSQAVFTPNLGECDALKEATWRILRVSEPQSCFLDFDELWYSPPEATEIQNFPLWPLQHPIYLYINGRGREVEKVVTFMNSSDVSWSLL